ncbi:MAG: hypothetical protein IJY39_03720 [Clostridia bacterium]|nr:hypothetical protein [Clostridia bacterium]
MKDQTILKIATFNVGDFSGIGMNHGSDESRNEYRKIMSDIGADLWFLQEDYRYFNEETKEMAFNAVYSSIHPNYERYFTWAPNGKAFLSSYDLHDVHPVDYIGDVQFRHPWFLVGNINVNGKKITLINLHFDWYDKNVRAIEIDQVIEFAKAQEYCIIAGDFNPSNRINEKIVGPNPMHEEDFAKFRNAGFQMANCGDFGVFHTILDAASGVWPFDNIMVKPNMKIVAAERVAEPWMHDHAIVIADIEIQ